MNFVIYRVEELTARDDSKLDAILTTRRRSWYLRRYLGIKRLMSMCR